MEKTYKRYRDFLLVVLASAMVLFAILLWRYVEYEIPDQLQIFTEDAKEWESVLEGPFVTCESYTEASKNGQYLVDCYLFGIFPLKTIEVQMVEQKYVYASGSAIGIYLETEGVHVIDCAEIVNRDGVKSTPAKHIIQPGDYIYKVNETALNDKKKLMEMVEESNGEELKLEVLRDGELISLKIPPVLTEDGSYKLGIWVRDNVQGIGTMTYIDLDGTFGALGHGIKDSDTGVTLDISDGTLYSADIVSIKKGVDGTPGELQGTIHYGSYNRLGKILTNEDTGISGELTRSVDGRLAKKYYPIGMKQEIERGKATILCGEGDQIEEYEIEITDVTLNSKDHKKGLKIKVTDERLLDKTGGIVQGMSGSPIIQDGKLVGAVTHVLVNDPTRGYGIFIENMLDAAS